MPSDDDFFEVLPAGEMRAKYGLTAENRPTITLDPAKVPPGLRHLIPLAEQFGISDDLIREDLLAKTPPGDVETVQRFVEAHNDRFNDWLVGSAAIQPRLSPEYIAFTCLLM